jgi:hypothetical protein
VFGLDYGDDRWTAAGLSSCVVVNVIVRKEQTGLWRCSCLLHEQDEVHVHIKVHGS